MSLGPEFQLIFSIRPRSLTGTLIHIGSQSGQHLSVSMEAGKVCLHGRGEGARFYQQRRSKSEARVQMESNVIHNGTGLETNLPFFFINKSCYHSSSASSLKF